MSQEIEKLERELSRVMARVDSITEELTSEKLKLAFLRSQLAQTIHRQNNPHIINGESGS